MNTASVSAGDSAGDLAPAAALPPPPAGHPPPAYSQAAGESARAFEAFLAYAELGSGRRYSAVGRKVGAGLRTIKRWAVEFDWRGRIKANAAQAAEQCAEFEQNLHREDLLDSADRAKAFRDRQYALAENMLDAAERYLENLDVDDHDAMNFADACKALEIASRIGQRAASQSAANDPQDRTLRDQMAALLDQVYPDPPTSTPTIKP
jgi:hypothetical protein